MTRKRGFEVWQRDCEGHQVQQNPNELELVSLSLWLSACERERERECESLCMSEFQRHGEGCMG